MIYLTPDIASAKLDGVEDALFVVKDGWPVPECASRSVSWSSFASDYKSLSHGESTLVLVGLSKIRTPSNRGDPVWGYLHNQRPDLRKISLDRTLFVSEPWRAFFQFYWTHVEYGIYTYSYFCESHWKAAQEGVREDPFSLSEILRIGSGHVIATDDRYFTDVSVRVVPTTESAKADYEALKEACFNQETTLPAIVRRLSEFAKQQVPERFMSTASRLFDRRKWEFTISDLAVDRFLSGGLQSLVELTNGIYGGFHGHHFL